MQSSPTLKEFAGQYPDGNKQIKILFFTFQMLYSIPLGSDGGLVGFSAPD